MGLTPHEYYCMTPAEYILKKRGYSLKISKEWEQTRVIAHNVYLNRPIKGTHEKATEWMPLPSDKYNKKGITKTVDEMKASWNKFKNK